MTGLSCLSILALPLRLAFEHDLAPYEDLLYVTDFASDVIFILDIVLQFHFSVICNGVELDSKQEIGMPTVARTRG